MRKIIEHETYSMDGVQEGDIYELKKYVEMRRQVNVQCVFN